MSNPDHKGFTPETKQSKVWEEEGTVYITDPETGMIVHDKEITLEEAKKVRSVKINIESGGAVSQISMKDFYTGHGEGPTPVKHGEECAYVGKNSAQRRAMNLQ